MTSERLPHPLVPYPRDMVGYGAHPPNPRWPDGANVAVQFVLNYEEGAENNVLDGDTKSETFLSEMIGAQAFPNRHMSMESLYEYGSRAGVWRVLRAFERRGLPLTIFAVARAMQRNPEAAAAFVELGHEIACHGLRWLDVAGWCSVAPRSSYRRLMNARTIPFVDNLDAWSAVCFVVRSGYRRRGLMHDLLAGAVEHAAAHRAPAVEGYPVDAGGERVDVISGYVGTVALFEKAGFVRAASTTGVSGGVPRVVMRRALG